MAQKLRGGQTAASFAEAQKPKPPGMTPSQWETGTGNKISVTGSVPSVQLTPSQWGTGTRNKPLMAPKLRGGQTAASFAEAQKPKPPGMTPSQWETNTGNKLLSYGTDSSGNLMTGNMSYMRKDLWDSQEKERQNQIDARQFKVPTDISTNNQTQIGQSFEKMGLGKIGGLEGRMGQLEQASMRLAQAASSRRMDETEQEYKMRGALTSQEAALKGGLLGQEYGLRDNLAKSQSNIESAQAAQVAGYSSPFEMQTDTASKRRENEKRQKEREAKEKAKEKEQERIAKAASRGYSAFGNLLPQYYPTR